MKKSSKQQASAIVATDVRRLLIRSFVRGREKISNLLTSVATIPSFDHRRCIEICSRRVGNWDRL
jgi:hypothetical protein